MPNAIIQSNEDILDLIHCKKIIPDQPRRPSEKNRTISQSFKVCSLDGLHEFSVFIAYSGRMPQDFSLGLMYDNHLLLRCNGFHGTTRAGFVNGHHAYPHGHLLTIDDIQNGRSKKPSKILDYTGKYIDIRTATMFFFGECAIMDDKDYFNLNQLSMFDWGDSSGDSE